MQTIVELPEYLREAEKVLGDEEKSGIINALARRPKSGVLITGTGGIRKLRWVRLAPEKVVASESFTTTTIKVCRSFC